MNDPVYLVIETVTGSVVNAVVGEPPPMDGFESLERTGAAVAAWIGWTRAEDGTFVAPPPPPEPPSEGDTDPVA